MQRDGPLCSGFEARWFAPEARRVAWATNVQLDGTDVLAFDHAAYHAAVAIVSQEPVLFFGHGLMVPLDDLMVPLDGLMVTIRTSPSNRHHRTVTIKPSPLNRHH